MSESGVLARGAALVSGARVLGLLATLLQVKLTVTHLGADRYGLLMTVVLFVNLAAAWSELGVGAVVVRRVAGGGANLERQVGLSLAFSLLLLGPLLLATNGIAHLLYAGRTSVLVGVAVLSAGLAATTIATCFQPVAQVRHRFGYLTAMDVLGRPLSLLLVWWATLVDGGLIWFFLAQLAIPFANLATMLVLAHRSGRFRPVWAFPEIAGLLREALPLTYIALVGTIYFNVDGILLSLLSTAAAVGAYAFAYRTVWHVTIVSTSIGGVLLARLSRDAARPAVWRATTATALRAVAVVAAPVGVLVAPFASELVTLVGSAEMARIAAAPVTVVAVAVGASMVSDLASVALIARGRQGVLTRLNTFGLALNIGLNLLLIPRFDAVGAAVALLATELVGMSAALWLIFRDDAAAAPWGVLRLVLPLAAAAAVAHLPGPPWPVLLLAATLTYAAGVLALRVVRPDEIRALRGGSPGDSVVAEGAAP